MARRIQAKRWMWSTGTRDKLWWERAIDVVIVVHRQANLLQVVAALHSPRRFARRLHRWQQQGDQNADDGNNNQELN